MLIHLLMWNERQEKAPSVGIGEPQLQKNCPMEAPALQIENCEDPCGYEQRVCCFPQEPA